MTFAVAIVFQPSPAFMRYNAPGVRCGVTAVWRAGEPWALSVLACDFCLRSTKKLSAMVKFQDDAVKNRSDINPK